MQEWDKSVEQGFSSKVNFLGSILWKIDFQIKLIKQSIADILRSVSKFAIIRKSQTSSNFLKVTPFSQLVRYTFIAYLGH